MTKIQHKNLIIISGPTATGKTALGLQMAKFLQNSLAKKVSILNFDSLLFYKELNIGTAKPTREERQNIPHYMIDCESARSPINAALYVEKARPLLEELLIQDHIVLLIGGSGFYLRALLEGMYSSQTTPVEIHQKSQHLYQTQGIGPFWDFLRNHDPESFESLHINDHYRIIRAVEHYWTTQTKFSEAKKIHEQEKNLAKLTAKDKNIMHCSLDIPKPIHQTIIEQRTQEMISKGLIEEVQGLFRMGFTGEERPLQSIGYKEMIDYLKNPTIDLKQCIERIVISTRQLAKAQRTWFKKVPERKCYNPLTDQQKIFEDVQAFLKASKSSES